MNKFILTAASACASLLIVHAPVYAGEATGALTTIDEVETVFVTASPFVQDTINMSSSVAQITQADLLELGGVGLGDALKNVPGVTSSGFAPGAARPVIRGLGATRVRITENGLGSHDVSDISDDHGVPIDPLASLEVEVLRGPATLRYGNQAIGGVVNAINNRIPMDLGEGKNFVGFSGISSNGAERLVGGLADYRSGNLAFHADGILRGIDDYETPEGTQVNSFAFTRGFSLGGAYIADTGAGGLAYNQFHARYGIPTEPDPEEIAHVELDQKNYTGALRFTMPVPGISLVSANGAYSDYAHSEVVQDEGAAVTFNNKEWEGRLETIHEGFGAITTGAIGFQYDTRDFEAVGEEADYLLPTETDSFGAYIFEELALSDSFRLQGAARVDWTNATGEIEALDAYDLDFTPVSFSLGTVFRPMMGDTSLFMNVSRTERAPAVTELFAQGAHEATATFEFGDPNLDKESAVSIEGGVRHQDIEGSSIVLSVYNTNYSDFIFGLLTGNSYDGEGTFFPDDSEEFQELLYSRADANFWGLESQLHRHLFETMNGHFGVDAQADYVRATFDGGGNVPRIPPFRAGGGIFYESTSFEGKVGFLYNAAQNNVAENETPTESFTTVDAAATVHLFMRPIGNVDLVLSGTNLTDSVGRNHVSFTKDHVLQPGRTLRLMVHLAR